MPRTVASNRTQAKQRMVAEKTLQLFAKFGYDKVSFSDISEATGVPRTAIYRYFKTKRDIFDAAIQAIILSVRAETNAVRKEPIPAVERLKKVCLIVIDRLYQEQDFVNAVFKFVFSKLDSGEEMANRVAAFTGGLKKTFSELIAAGMADGSIRNDTDAPIAVELLFSIMESTVLKMLIGMEKEPTAAKTRVKVALQRL